jgi:hypothetical protein
MNNLYPAGEPAKHRRQLAALLRYGAPPGPPATGPLPPPLDDGPLGATGVDWPGHGWAALDWEVLLRTALAERLDSLLYAALLSSGRLPMLPRALAAKLETAHWRTKIANLLALDAIGQLSGALAAVDVPLVLLKGGALAFGLYTDPARRPLGDIDILVPPDAVAKTLRVMELLGYHAVGSRRGIPSEHRTGATLAPPADSDRSGWRSEITLVREGKLPTQVDLHWGLNSRTLLRRSMDPAWFWEHTTPLPLWGRAELPGRGAAQGPVVRVFDAEAQLLHLCAHTLQHGTPRLRWTYDIALLMARRTIDWDLVLAAAAAFRLGLALQGTLAAVWVLWGTAPPAGIQARLDSLDVSRAEMRTWRLACSGDSRALQTWDAANLGSVHDILDAWLAAALPPQPDICRRYGVRDARLLPGLYLYRAVSGSVRGAWGMLRRWRE